MFIIKDHTVNVAIIQFRLSEKLLFSLGNSLGRRQLD